MISLVAKGINQTIIKVKKMKKGQGQGDIPKKVKLHHAVKTQKKRPKKSFAEKGIIFKRTVPKKRKLLKDKKNIFIW